MYALERAAMADGTVAGLTLMERAGDGCVAALFDHWPDLVQGAGRAVVLAGPGNNGGDGFVIARLLAARGWIVTVFGHGWDALIRPGVAQAKKPADALANAKRWLEGGGALHSLEAADAPAALAAAITRAPGPVVLIDALLGLGQARRCDGMLAPVRGALDRVLQRSADLDLRIAAVDIPTGYVTDDGAGARCADAPLEPDLVITFHAEKPVHRHLASRGIPVRIVDIGL
ncbi:NAD(P)H-hydrate epimerase [Cognatishimia sp. F0-27]|nr:NAD(P)H-hydrate epimerase [Cognatishimia sp. F0-27]